MSQPPQQAPQYLNGLIDRLYSAINVKFKNLYDAFEAIWPDPRTGFNGNLFLPLSTSFQLQTIQYAWKDFYDKNRLNQLIQGVSITVDVDNIIGEAIQNRMQTTQQITPRPYQHQAETIAWALHALNNLREWLHSNTPQNVSLTKPFDVLALLAPTASGKTEVLETVAIQLALDGKAAGFNTTKVIMIYPMREFMKDHFIRFIRDLAYIKTQKNIDITIGILNEDTPKKKELSNKDIKNYLSIFFPTDQLGNLKCPICGSDLNTKVLRCKGGHDFTFIRLTRGAIAQEPPDILLITPDMLNYVTRIKTYEKVFGINAKGFPLLIIMDEPHLYSGVFGTNVSLLIRDLRKLVETAAKTNFNTTYTPLILVTSATIPNADVFLSKLFVVEPSRIKIIQVQQQQQLQLSNKGLIAWLPTVGWGLKNASIELIPVIAALLPPDKRKILVFVDSVERANRLVYQIEDYISRYSGFWQEYDVCNNVGKIFDPSICSNGVPDYHFIKVASLSAKMHSDDRNEIARKFRAGDINVLIATSALEVGVDIGDVDIAILIGLPPTPINFEQRVGRVGRRGQPSLVVVLGNEVSGVDAYYLSDLNNRLINYIRSARKYEIPINPANPYAIRAYVGNFATSLTWKLYPFQALSTPINVQIQKIIDEYIDMTIDKPINVFSSAPSKLSLIAQYLQANGSALKQQLRSFPQALAKYCIGKRCKIPSFKSKSWVSISSSWSGILSKNFGLLRVKTPLDEIRSLGIQVDLVFKVADRSSRSSTRLKDDAILSILTYSISYTPPASSAGLFEGELAYTSRLRGVVTLKPTRLPNGKIAVVPFETVGGKFVSLALRMPSICQQINNFVSHISDNVRTLESIVDALQYIKSSTDSLEYRRLIFEETAGKLKEIFNIYLSNLNQKLQGGSFDCINDLKVVVPVQWRFRLPEPSYFIDNNNNLVYVKKFKGRKIFENLKQLLFYYEVELDKYYPFVNKIDIPPSVLSAIGPVVGVHYDIASKDLIIETQKAKISYINNIKNAQGKIKVANIVITYPLVMPILIDEGNTIQALRGNGITVELKTVKLLYANIGYTVESNVVKKWKNKKVRRYPKFVDGKNDPTIIGEVLDTYAVKITIDWTQWFGSLNQSLRQTLIGEISQDLINIDVKNVSRWDKVFAVTVSHSLAHILLNYHPIYTGGERKDVGELLVVKDDQSSGGALKTEIYLFDTVHGGNGVSELLYSYLSDILHDASTVMLQRHIKSRGFERFYGEPGDVILGTWPRCIYGNLALSRLWLLRFLAAHSGDDLSVWVNSGSPVPFSFP
jgi:ATP-dependent helicase YprA (DUF1998 family)